MNENSGGKYSKSADGPLGEKVIVDGKLITGQSPASAYGVGNELSKALGIKFFCSHDSVKRTKKSIHD